MEIPLPLVPGPFPTTGPCPFLEGYPLVLSKVLFLVLPGGTPVTLGVAPPAWDRGYPPDRTGCTPPAGERVMLRRSGHTGLLYCSHEGLHLNFKPRVENNFISDVYILSLSFCLRYSLRHSKRTLGIRSKLTSSWNTITLFTNSSKV